jgi:DNA-binding MarR family transcriptional regulator
LGGKAIVTQVYFDLTRLVERLHRRFLDVLKAELDHLGVDDINPVQSLILANIESEEITVRDLVRRGYYLGSNASYNIKKLVESGYLDHERSPRDRRSVRIKLTPKALDLCTRMRALEEVHAKELTQSPEGAASLEGACNALHELERRWSDTIRMGPSEG